MHLDVFDVAGITLSRRDFCIAHRGLHWGQTSCDAASNYSGVLNMGHVPLFSWLDCHANYSLEENSLCKHSQSLQTQTRATDPKSLEPKILAIFIIHILWYLIYNRYIIYIYNTLGMTGVSRLCQAQTPKVKGLAAWRRPKCAGLRPKSSCHLWEVDLDQLSKDKNDRNGWNPDTNTYIYIDIYLILMDYMSPILISLTKSMGSHSQDIRASTFEFTRNYFHKIIS